MIQTLVNASSSKLVDIDALEYLHFKKQKKPSKLPHFERKISLPVTYVPTIPTYNQSVVVKVSYNYRGNPSSWSSEFLNKSKEKAKQNTQDAIEYLYRFDDMKGFSSNQDEISKEKAHELFDNSSVFKIMVSPEDGRELDKDYIKAFVRQIESAKGIELKWTAVIHENTNKKHAHILISRTEPNPHSWEKPLMFSSQTIKTGLREEAERLSTFRLGKKSALALRRSYIDSINNESSSKLDFLISRNRLFTPNKKDHFLDLSAEKMKKLPEWQRVLVLKRLEILSKKGIGIFKSPQGYKVNDIEWMMNLREEAIKRPFHESTDKPIEVIQPSKPLNHEINGVIKALDVVDENSSKVSILFEADDGREYIIQTEMLMRDFRVATGKGIRVYPNNNAQTKRYKLPQIEIEGISDKKSQTRRT